MLRWQSGSSNPEYKQYLHELNNELNRKDISSFVSPLLQYKIEKINKFDIYLPIIKKNKGWV